MINANWLFLIIPACFILGVFLRAVFASGKEADKQIQETMDKDEKLEIIEEAFNEYGDCEHDVIQPASDTPGEHFVSYWVDKKGREKILEVL